MPLRVRVPECVAAGPRDVHFTGSLDSPLAGLGDGGDLAAADDPLVLLRTEAMPATAGRCSPLPPTGGVLRGGDAGPGCGRGTGAAGPHHRRTTSDGVWGSLGAAGALLDLE